MKLKEVSLFKAVNISMAIFCFGAGIYNYCGVNVLTNNQAESDFNGSIYKYEIQNNSFSISKDNELVGNLNVGRNLEFRKNNFPSLACNAGAIAAAGTIAGSVAAASGASAAVAAGTVAGNAIAAAQVTGGVASIVKFAAIGVAAASPVGLFVGAFALT